MPTPRPENNLKHQHYSRLRLILGDQLNAEHSWFKEKDDSTLYVIAELHQEQTYVRHHVQKICAFFKAMENFAHALRKAGHQVCHLTLDDTHLCSDLPALIERLIEQFNCQFFEYQKPDEFRLLQQLTSLKHSLSKKNISCTEFDTEHFILPFDEIPLYFKKQKHVRMEQFYRKMRQRFNILMEADQPLGGQWNYDEDNRNAFHQQDLSHIPEPLLFANPVSEILNRLDRHKIDYFGTKETQLLWPCNRQQAKTLCQYFIRHCLAQFGRFQDAMTDQTKHAWSLYHSRLSFALNTKMLHPLDVIDIAIEAFHTSEGNISVSQIEGFVRQILGWREYVRGMYWINMPEFKEQNAQIATRSLPDWFWTANTKMNCLHHAIKQSLDFAYAHHIQRLMLIGNFSLLAGLNPDEVDAWYLGIYIDAIEWVELPNTRGMALFADNGWIATKPYAASGNYINQMSDHCKSCHYKVKLKTGEKACPFNSLYWHFINQHKERFNKNPRMAFPYKTWAKMSETNQQGLLYQAENYLNKLDDL